MIQLRRGLIDKISALLPTCELFKENAIYPRRYFDDLMLDNNIETVKPDPSTNPLHSMNKIIAESQAEMLLHPNSSNFLPELNMPFGIGTKNEYTSAAASVAGLHTSRQFMKTKNRKQNQSMTIEASNVET